jgi:hypothetical protein
MSDQRKWEHKMMFASEAERLVLKNQEPYMLFFRSVIDFNNDTVRKKLNFYKSFFEKNDTFTIRDKTFIARALFDDLATEDDRSKRVGVGANYEVNVRKNFNDFVSNINKMLNEDDLKCKK